MVAVVKRAGSTGVAGLKIGSGEDPDVSDGGTGMAGGGPVFFVFDLKKKIVITIR